MTPPRRALLALLLLVPAASLGTMAGLAWGPGTWWGQSLYALAKLYLLALPLFWLLRLDRQPLSLSPPRHGGLLPGLALGLLMAALTLGAYAIARHHHWLSPANLKALAAKNHLTNPAIYFAFALWTTLVNALEEEYVWRWFVTEKSAELLAPFRIPHFALRILPAALAAACFTLHHALVLALYFPPAIVLLASLGVFLGGFLWSLLYLRYRSLWPAYLAHTLADLAIFVIGYHLIFLA